MLASGGDRGQQRNVVAFATAFAFGWICAVAVPACSGGDASPTSIVDGTQPAPNDARCTPCVQDTDCGDGVCAQFGSDSFCASVCAKGNECGADSACTSVSTTAGAQARACLPRNDACGSAVGPSRGGGSGGGAKHGGGGALDAGGPVVGAIGPTGGTISRLYFAVVGDTRPPAINDTAGYPTEVITQIWSGIEALNPRPPFAVTTGDYMFARAGSAEAAPQLEIYLKARASYSNVVFPTMGNHECTGGVSTNCGPGNADGVTTNYDAYVTKLLAPIGQTSPNYAIDIGASDGSWTSKLVFVAGNAWSDADSAWLESTLSKPTTYTFIIRHEPRAASSAPGCRASEQIMAQHPYTLAIVGHTHTYGRTGARQVTIGNGGAPLTGGASYGFGIVQQRADGAIQVDMVDYQTGQTDSSFRFALNPDGSAAP